MNTPVNRQGTERPPREYDPNKQVPPRAANSGGASHEVWSNVTDTDATAPPADRERAALIRSIAAHVTDDTQVIDEIRAILAGATISDLLVLRGVA